MPRTGNHRPSARTADQCVRTRTCGGRRTPDRKLREVQEKPAGPDCARTLPRVVPRFIHTLSPFSVDKRATSAPSPAPDVPRHARNGANVDTQVSDGARVRQVVARERSVRAAHGAFRKYLHARVRPRRSGSCGQLFGRSATDRGVGAGVRTCARRRQHPPRRAFGPPGGPAAASTPVCGGRAALTPVSAGSERTSRGSSRPGRRPRT
jgi:hypothetical protein